MGIKNKLRKCKLCTNLLHCELDLPLCCLQLFLCALYLRLGKKRTSYLISTFSKEAAIFTHSYNQLVPSCQTLRESDIHMPHSASSFS